MTTEKFISEETPEDPSPVIFFDSDDTGLSSALEELVGRADARQIMGDGYAMPLSEALGAEDLESAAISSLLLHAFGSSKPRIQYGEDHSVYTDVVSEGGVVSAKGCLSTAKEWASSFLHGPDVVYALAGLAHESLKEDEKFVELRSVEFRKTMNRQLDLFASDDEQKLHAMRDFAPAINGSLRTGRGRTIFVAGYTTDEALSSTVNRLSRLPSDILGYGLRERVEYCENLNNNTFRFPFMGYEVDGIASFQKQLHTAQELVMSMVSVNVCQDFFGTSLTLAGGFSSFRPPCMSYFRNPGWVVLSWMPEQKKITTKGFHLIPCRVEFLNKSLQTRGGGFYTHIAPSSPEVYKDFVEENFPEFE